MEMEEQEVPPQQPGNNISFYWCRLSLCDIFRVVLNSYKYDTNINLFLELRMGKK